MLLFTQYMLYSIYRGGVAVTKCILSGLEIPEGKETKEHLVPKSRLMHRVDDPANIFPAHKVINCMKGDLLPCEFENLKYHLAQKAIHEWKIKPADKNFIIQAALNWSEGYSPNWCDICILNCKGRQR